MSTYSFTDVVAAITGIGGASILGSSAGAAEEGITIEAVADKNVMVIGADGKSQNSLIANEASTVTVRLEPTGTDPKSTGAALTACAVEDPKASR